ncbi:MAG: hypothetical protein HFE68_05535, partial [Erysipelotrichaceae bacterium]|nr:hypothetical protein [Erysipelotrichaceae bacterium]
VYVIFISKHDVIGQGKASYHINRTIAETGEDFGDGSHIIYVNGSYRGDDPIGKLMHDLHCKNPDEMYYEEIARSTRYYKENKEGNDKMCQAMEEFEQRAIQKGVMVGRKEGRKEGMKEGRERGRREGLKEGHKVGHKKGHKLGLKVGRQEGREEGKRESITAIVKRMLASEKFTIEQIAQLVGITKNEIYQLSQD